MGSAHSHSSSRLVVFALQETDPLPFKLVESDLHSWELDEALLARRKLSHSCCDTSLIYTKN